MKKKFLKLFILLCTVIISVSAFSGCFMLGHLIDEKINNTDGAFQLIGETGITSVYDETMECYDVMVDGTIQNVSDKAWDSLSVTLILYDKDGNGLGMAYGYMDYIEAHGTWRFCAEGTTKFEPTSTKLHEINGFVVW